MSDHVSIRDRLLLIALAVIPVVAASALGSLATMPQIPGWYAGLIKPSFNPPNWVFGPVWTTLYALMAYAVWRILAQPAHTPGRKAALMAFYGQLVLNALWSWAFFAAQSPLGGLIVIAVLFVMILATLWLFRPLDRIATACLVPYAVWVAYASVLNVAIWNLNPTA